MTNTWPFKDPDETLAYGFNWTPRHLGVIQSSTAVVTTGSVVVDSHGVASITDPATGVVVAAGKGTQTWLSGGTVGETCRIELTAIDDVGDIAQETVTIKIKER